VGHGVWVAVYVGSTPICPTIMQTFLPLPDFRASAEVMDYKRLGKQRVEAFQLLNSLTPGYSKKGWLNHPARLMWIGYTPALRNYLAVFIDEWVCRGYRNTMVIPPYEESATLPHWFGSEAFHASHRANLIRKDTFYRKWGWTESPDMPYIWPSPLPDSVDPVTGAQL